MQRRRIRSHLTEWCRFAGFEPALHHRLLIDQLERVARGEVDRLAIFMPPGSAKSTYGSVLFPPWFMARNPGMQVLAASHTTELAERWGRKVRGMLDEHGAMLGASLSPISNAAGRWALMNGSEYFAAGVGTGIAGFRADLCVIDDPLRSRKDADSELNRNDQWEWYVGDVLPRIKPGCRIVLIQCMTGDTPVMLADGSKKSLKDIRPGDKVSTYKDGVLSTSFVLNWTNNGLDRIFTIKMTSGITVRANERHPFLVYEGGGLKWVRTKDLCRGCSILKVNGGVGSVKHAHVRDANAGYIVADFVTVIISLKEGLIALSRSLVCSARSLTRMNGLRRDHDTRQVPGENGRERRARGEDAESQLKVAVTALLTTIRKDGQVAFARLRLMLYRSATRISSIAMGLLARNISVYLPSKMESVPYAGSLRAPMFEPTGTENFASIIVTMRTRLEGFCATIATLLSDTQKQRKSLSPSLNISDFILDKVLEVSDAGVEEVFDIQIDQTENFIANGLVSHNTRWHEDDLAGRILEDAKRTGRTWRVISLPAVAEADDLLGRQPGEYLWDDAYGYGQTLRDAEREQTPRNWSALFQQRPAPETGDYFKEEWLRPYVTAPDLGTLTVYGGSDFAVTADGGDYTVHAVVGIDPEHKPWLLDLWRGQTASDKWVDVWCDLSKQWKPNGWAFEQGQIKSGVGPFLKQRARERNCWTDMRDFPTRGDKAVRAQSMRGRMAMLGLGVPIGKPWYPALRAELLSFPAGKHDDQVDALGLVGQLLDIMGSGRKRSIDDVKWEPSKDAYRVPSVEIPMDNFKTM